MQHKRSDEPKANRNTHQKFYPRGARLLVCSFPILRQVFPTSSCQGFAKNFPKEKGTRERQKEKREEIENNFVWKTKKITWRQTQKRNKKRVFPTSSGQGFAKTLQRCETAMLSKFLTVTDMKWQSEAMSKEHTQWNELNCVQCENDDYVVYLKWNSQCPKCDVFFSRILPYKCSLTISVTQTKGQNKRPEEGRSIFGIDAELPIHLNQ